MALFSNVLSICVELSNFIYIYIEVGYLWTNKFISYNINICTMILSKHFDDSKR
jgi:hypothetical protein